MADRRIRSLLLDLAASHPDVRRAVEEERAARYNSPEARGARSRRSTNAAATVRKRREAEEQRWRDEEDRLSDGPVCDGFGIILQAQEVNCVRSPHRRGDHEDLSGNRWPVYDEEFEDMLTVTTENLQALLAGASEEPVLYVVRDDDTREPVRLEVWDAALVDGGDIVVRKHDLVDALGGPDHPDGVTQDALEHALSPYQDTVNEILESEEPADDECVDSEGVVRPEHDYPAEDEGGECRRCGAEASMEPDGVYDGEIR
jgi:hypothetical protein